MPRSPPDTHVDHLKSLLGQRSTRADIRGNISAVSEYSDTPSVYSRPFFSPKSPDNSEYQDYPSPGFNNIDRPNDYTSSMLYFDDLDDDTRSSFARSETINIDDTGYESDGDNNSTARMSYLGPKMRFHSRAPWESEDETLEEELESHRSLFPFRGNGAKSVTSSSSSPRPSYSTSRPSGESSRSANRSFETINSQLSYQPGSFYNMAQESVSSFERSTPSIQKETLRSRFSLSRLRSEESSHVDLSPSSNPSPGRSPLNSRFPPYTRDNGPFVACVEPPMDTVTSHTAKEFSVKIEGSVHPYANPALAVSYSQPPFRATSSYEQRTSDETMSESPNSIPRTGVRDITTGKGSHNHRMPSIQPKNISSPVPLIGTTHQIETSLAENHLEQNPNLSINNLPGWTDSNTVPAFSLISLEEARAQRMRSVTANPTSKLSDAGGMSNPSSMFSSIEAEAAPRVDSSPVGGSTARVRARSISAGANKARSALQTIVSQTKPDRRDTEPAITVTQPSGAGHPGKTLKHKKSGLMRLFTAGKVPEKDEQAILPPVPSLTDSHSINHVLPVVQWATKTSVHRVPVPRLSPSSLETSSAQNHDALTSDSRKQSTKRNLGLSVNTQQLPVVGVVSASIMDDRGSQTQPSRKLDQPLQSAPAIVSEFPALKLRPVSTLFSAHFGDHIVATDSRPSSDIDSATPRPSSPAAVAALTPTSATQTSHEQPSIVSSLDDQAPLVRSLQEQLAVAKKAWQLHIWELEEQVRNLKATVEELKGSDNKNYCQSCGRGKEIANEKAVPHSKSVVHRPRARTGTSSRFTNALP